ncbi:monocarboxylate transporter 12 [Procambarus clarkii]|uniref:monocarboxylate transporter 12 n=1 Tax=Procambarus clarkii TaxID=6728 RepID=UPI003742B715
MTGVTRQESSAQTADQKITSDESNIETCEKCDTDNNLSCENCKIKRNEGELDECFPKNDEMQCPDGGKDPGAQLCAPNTPLTRPHEAASEGSCATNRGNVFPDEKQTLTNLDVAEKSTGGMVVPDGGWGWLVALGSFIISMLALSLAPCFGILFSGFLLDLNTPSATTSWIFNIQWLIWHLMGPLVRPLAKEFGWRRIGYLGGLLVSSSIIISAFSPSAQFLFFSYSLLSGIGGGLVCSVSFITLPMYFDRRRGLSNTFLVVGICAGQTANPPLVRYLLAQYTFKGAALILGGIMMNCLVAVTLFQPVKWHMKPRRGKTDPPQEGLALLKPQTESSGHRECVIVSSLVVDEERPNEKSESASAKGDERLRPAPADGHRESHSSLNIVMSGDVAFGVFISSTESLGSVDRQIDHTSLGCMLRLKGLIMRVTETLLADMVVLRSYRALIISFGNLFSLSSYFNFVMMVPFAMRAAGHSLEDAAWCISVMGFCNLVTRLVISPLADWKRFNMRLCALFGYAIMTIAIFVFPFLRTVTLAAVAMAVFGFGLGSAVTLNNLLIIKFMGVEKQPATFGVTSLITGFGFPIFGSLTGFIRDASGSYAISLWVLAAIMSTAIVLWLMMPAAVACDLRRSHQATRATARV